MDLSGASEKIPSDTTGDRSGTFRLVGQRLNYYATPGIRQDSEWSGRGLIDVFTEHFPRLAEKNHGSTVCVPWPPTQHKSRALPLHKSAVPIQPVQQIYPKRRYSSITLQAVTSQTRVTNVAA
jgi:hypothetical protein